MVRSIAHGDFYGGSNPATGNRSDPSAFHAGFSFNGYNRPYLGRSLALLAIGVERKKQNESNHYFFPSSKSFKSKRLTISANNA